MFGAANVKVRRLQFGTILKPEEKRLAYTSFFRDLISGTSVTEDPLAGYPWEDGMDAMDWLMRHDQSFYLPDCLMVKTDIASMANGLEVRCPFLDHEFVEFAATIPSRLKRNGTDGKLILKRAVKELLPTEIMNKSKQGFGLPIAKWFRNDLAPMLKETLLDDKSKRRGFFEQHFLKKIVNEHIGGGRDWSNRLWAFLFLELWFREFID
jgi:asparagine synthase (glutamine-hydrolysing)